MQAAPELGGERPVDGALALDPAHSGKGIGDDMNIEMRFPAGRGPGMAGMARAVVCNLEAPGRKSLQQCLANPLFPICQFLPR